MVAIHQPVDIAVHYGDIMWDDTFFDLSKPQTVLLTNPRTLLLFLCCPRTEKVRTFADVPKKAVNLIVFGPQTLDAQDPEDRLTAECRLTARSVWEILNKDERQLLQNELWRWKTEAAQASRALNMAMRKPA